jgi:hypothetical protein
MMSSLLINGGVLVLLMSIALCVHAWRTGQDTFWLFIILFLQPIGGLVYLVIILLPSIFGGSRARQLGQAARATLDPGRGYRAAQKAHEDAPTVANKIRLASAAAAQGRWEEAEQLYREGAQGIHAEDPTLLLGRANALVELGRFAEAVPLLDQLAQDTDKGRTAAESLVLARAYEGLGRMTEAEAAYRFAVERLPGLEGIGRYAAFLAHVGRTDEARETVADMDRRIAKLQGPFRQEGRTWRNLAAEALG